MDAGVKTTRIPTYLVGPYIPPRAGLGGGHQMAVTVFSEWLKLQSIFTGPAVLPHGRRKLDANNHYRQCDP